MSDPDPELTNTAGQTESEIEFALQSMIHKVVVDMDPTKLELLDGFEQTAPGYKFSPPDTNVRLIITGRDWSEKRILIYGCTSTSEAEEYLSEFTTRIRNIGHNVAVISGPEITNLAVGGRMNSPLDLMKISSELREAGYKIEYEPEQFPAVILKIEDPSATILLFSTGSFVLQGLSKYDSIEPALSRIQTLIEPE